MTVEIKAPAFPESVADGVVSAWHKGPGDSVARDELLVEIETDKVVMEVVAPEPGVIEAIMVSEGETSTSEAVLATLVAGAVSAPAPSVKTSGSIEDAPDAETGQGDDAAPHVQGEQERVDDAVYVMQRQTVQNPVPLRDFPRLGKRINLRGQRAVRVHGALWPASNDVRDTDVNTPVTTRVNADITAHMTQRTGQSSQMCKESAQDPRPSIAACPDRWHRRRPREGAVLTGNESRTLEGPAAHAGAAPASSRHLPRRKGRFQSGCPAIYVPWPGLDGTATPALRRPRPSTTRKGPRRKNSRRSS